jgi:predicted pyridoxine 5'-phosphate oxidase superfamily flavin-nucleotide-binding protein
MRAIIASAKLSFVATASPDGSPSLSPKGSLRVLDETHLAFANIASPQTVENLRRDDRIEVNCVDLLRRRGYRFTGTVRIVSSTADPVHGWMAKWLLDTHGPTLTATDVIVVSVDRAQAVRSPAYTVLGAEEDTLLTTWSKEYGMSAVRGESEDV